jgi:Tfp pilus assembly major pilin PilA
VRRLVDILGALAIVGIIIAVALPGFADYTPRASVAAALVFIGKAREALETSCSDGTFASKQELKHIGLPESDPRAFVYRAELQPLAHNSVRLTTALTDVYGRPFFGLFLWKVIAQGSILEYEFTCLAQKKLASRFVASTVEPKYLPAGLRSQ